MPSMAMRSWRAVFMALGILVACEDATGPGPATQAAFDLQPASSVASAQPLGTVRVVLLDAEGRVSRSSAIVTIELETADPAAQLSGSTTANAVAGVATFSDLNVAKAGAGFRLIAKTSGIGDVLSDPFEVVPGPATQLRIENGISAFVYPRCVPDVLPFTVRVTDAAGNPVTSATPPVTLSLARTGAFGMTLSTDDNVYGTTTRTAVGGIAHFDDISVHKSGVYGITATAGGLTPATASGFVGGCWVDRLVFIKQPIDGTVGASLDLSVLRVDAYGNATSEQHSPGPSYSVAITLGNNPAGAALSGTLVVFGPGTSSRDFTNVFVDKPGTGYTLVATSGGSIAVSVTSAQFSIK
ncbi:MAG TPA: hypothetical protein VKH19_09520 [Gemmatimonadaceae bacterium]|nr:hypothetical protein [Gemmatimonadaceae bacterium]